MARMGIFVFAVVVAILLPRFASVDPLPPNLVRGETLTLVQEVESIVEQFAPVFGRKATFGWFVIVVWSLMLRMDMAGVTSIVRCMGMEPGQYLNVLHFFHSTAFSVNTLCEAWGQIAHTLASPVCLHATPLCLVDGIKVGKAGRRMPGVKLLHQESGNNTKPEYIMGHYWGAISAVVGSSKSAFALPLRCQIQDGLKRSPSEVATLIDKMGSLVTQTLTIPSIVCGDAYFTTKGFITALRSQSHHYIGRAKSNTVGYELPPPRPKGRRGRPRKYGDKVRLKEMFDRPTLFTDLTLTIYGQSERVRYRSIDLLWQRIHVRFVLTTLDNGTQAILLCTDRSLSPQDIIYAYSLRHKIEVTFKSLVHTLCAFGYHFWMKAMPKLKREVGDQFLHRAGEQYRAQVMRKIEAYERFVNISAIALGILQILSLKYPDHIWKRFPVWLRTLPKHGYPSENVVRLTLQHELHQAFLHNKDSLLLQEILEQKNSPRLSSHPMQIAA
jgi:hypothetical protein